MSNQDKIDEFSFLVVDTLIGAGLILREHRSKVAALVARKYEETFPEPQLRHEVLDNYGG